MSFLLPYIICILCIVAIVSPVFGAGNRMIDSFLYIFISLGEANFFLSHPLVKLSIVRSLRDREVVCSASDRQSFIFESFVWRAVTSHSFPHPQEVLLTQFSLYVHKSGIESDSFYFYIYLYHKWVIVITFLYVYKINVCLCTRICMSVYICLSVYVVVET